MHGEWHIIETYSVFYHRSKYFSGFGIFIWYKLRLEVLCEKIVWCSYWKYFIVLSTNGIERL
jgi:hypothetical protein